MTQESPSDGPLPPNEETGRADRPATHAPEKVQTLRQAMRRARFDDAERVGVLADLRVAKIGRLELLHEALRPLLSQIPADADLFDVGLMPGTTPRLFIDMIGFVEMGRDARLYRLLQDTRHSRVTIAETSEIATMVEAVTDYVARRLLERDKALAADDVAHRETLDDEEAPSRPSALASRDADRATASAVPPRARRRPTLRWLGLLFAFIIDLLGAISLFTLIAVAAWMLWTRMHPPV